MIALIVRFFIGSPCFQNIEFPNVCKWAKMQWEHSCKGFIQTLTYVANLFLHRDFFTLYTIWGEAEARVGAGNRNDIMPTSKYRVDI